VVGEVVGEVIGEVVGRAENEEEGEDGDLPLFLTVNFFFRKKIQDQLFKKKMKVSFLLTNVVYVNV